MTGSKHAGIVNVLKRRRPSKSVLAVSFAGVFLLCSRAFPQSVINIWPGLAPGTEGQANKETINNGRITDVYQPTLTAFLPVQTDKNLSGILIFPGGGYTHLAIGKEGYAIARWLNESGVAAFVLKYRLNQEQALQDAQRAIRLIRKEAGEFNLNRKRLGVMGFSAGGHLAANLAAHPDGGVLHDAIDSTSSRPDFMILLYGDIDSLVGTVNSNTPPTFLTHTDDDTRVPVEASVRFYMALHSHGVPAELHVYEKGKHGFGLLTERGPVVTWGDRCIDWLKVRGVLNGKP
jgi:acetyl esterase/lipase